MKKKKLFLRVSSVRGELREPEFQTGGNKIYLDHHIYIVEFYRYCNLDSFCAVTCPEDDLSPPLRYCPLSTVHEI